MDYLKFQLFDIKKPVVLEDLPEGIPTEIITTQDKTIIKINKTYIEDDLVEILAKVKLGEIDPLLVTFFFQPDLSKEESSLAIKFNRICLPLQSAWTYSLIRKYAPHTYDKEIVQLLKMFSEYQALCNLSKNVNEAGYFLDVFLPLCAILCENPKNYLEIKLVGDDDVLLNIIDIIKRYVHRLPSPYEYINYINELRAIPIVDIIDFKVDIVVDKKGYRHYQVKALE